MIARRRTPDLARAGRARRARRTSAPAASPGTSRAASCAGIRSFGHLLDARPDRAAQPRARHRLRPGPARKPAAAAAAAASQRGRWPAGGPRRRAACASAASSCRRATSRVPRRRAWRRCRRSSAPTCARAAFPHGRHASCMLDVLHYVERRRAGRSAGARARRAAARRPTLLLRVGDAASQDAASRSAAGSTAWSVRARPRPPPALRASARRVDGLASPSSASASRASRCTRHAVRERRCSSRRSSGRRRRRIALDAHDARPRGIAAWIPHRGAMCLLERMSAWERPRRSSASPATIATRRHPLRSASGLLARAAIEYAAQAMALHGALAADGRGQPRRARASRQRARRPPRAPARLDDLPAAAPDELVVAPSARPATPAASSTRSACCTTVARSPRDASPSSSTSAWESAQ